MIRLFVLIAGCIGISAFIIFAWNFTLTFASVKFTERKRIVKKERNALLVFLLCVGVVVLLTKIY